MKDHSDALSRLCAVLIDCKTSDANQAARVLSEAAGSARRPRPSEQPRQLPHAGDPPDEPIVEIQRVDHESRVHRDTETDDIPAEVGRLERWVVTQAPTANASATCGYSVAASQRMPTDGTKNHPRDFDSMMSQFVASRHANDADAR
jgi:hypothetical protein